MPRPTATPAKPKARKPRDHVHAYTDREFGAVDGDRLVFLHVDSVFPKHHAQLGAKDARLLARWLLRAADWIDAQRGAR